VICPECGAEVEQLSFCDGCYVRCCFECTLTMSPDCEHPTDVWIYCVKITKTMSGMPLNPPRLVRRSTHIAPLRPPVANRSRRLLEGSANLKKRSISAAGLAGWRFAIVIGYGAWLDSHPNVCPPSLPLFVRSFLSESFVEPLASFIRLGRFHRAEKVGICGAFGFFR